MNLCSILLSGMVILLGLPGPFAIADEGNPDSRQVYTLRADGSGDFPNIQAAVDAVVDGDLILLEPGTYIGPGNGSIDLLGKEITIRSEPMDPTTCILDLDGDGTAQNGFVLESGETLDTVIQGITIQNGYGGLGAAVWLDRSEATFLDCHFVENGIHGGRGALWVDRSDSEFYRCEFRDNRTSGVGAAVYSTFCVIRFEECLFSGNSADSYSGAVESYYNYSATFIDCDFIDNEARRWSGALGHIYGTLHVEDCHFEGNRAGLNGGAMRYRKEHGMTLLNSTFIGNESGDVGGALSIGYDGDGAFIEGCVFADNVSAVAGGAFSTENGETTISECTFVRNSAPTGSAIFSDAELLVERSIIAFAPEGDPVACDHGYTPTLTCCNLFGNADGDWVECIEFQFYVLRNRSEDPLFCDLDGNDFRLAEGSPCLPPKNMGVRDCGQIGAYQEGCGGLTIPVSHEDFGSEATVRRPANAEFSIRNLGPTPTSGVTQFELSLSADRAIEIDVVDVHGRVVESVRSRETMAPGVHSLSWNGNEQAAGVYWIRARSRDGEASVRVLILR